MVSFREFLKYITCRSECMTKHIVITSGRNNEVILDKKIDEKPTPVYNQSGKNETTPSYNEDMVNNDNSE